MDITSYLLGKNSGGGGGGGKTYFPPIYTNTEIQVGTWIDNKPLYMLTFTDTQTTDSSGMFEADLTTGITNIDTIFLGEDSYFMDTTDGVTYEPNSIKVTSGNVISWNHAYPKTDGKIYTNSIGIFSANRTINCVYNLFYTKTTDTAVQDISTINGYNFSQTEHTIGTDLQGNTIFEKTLDIYTSSYGNVNPINRTVAHNISNIKDIWLYGGSFLKTTGAPTQRIPANYLNYYQKPYRQYARANADKTNVYCYVGDFIFPAGSAHHYITLRYTKTA